MVRDEPHAPALALPWVVPLRLLLVLGEVALLVAAGEPAARAQAWAWAGPAFVAQLAAHFWLTQVTPRNDAGSERALAAVFGLDAVALTVVFHFSGGPANPFTLFYLVQITISALVLHKRWTWVLGLISTCLYGGLFLFPHPAAAEMPMAAVRMERHLVGMWVAFAFCAAEIAFFTGQVAEALQQRRREVWELQRKVARQERLASLVTLAAGAAHEMGTPLGTIAIAAREIELAAERRLQDPGLREDAQLIREQVERCRAILADMSAHGAEPVGEAREEVSIGTVFQRVVESLAPELRGRLEVDDANAAAGIVTFPASVVQSIVALVGNALDASGPNGQVRLGARMDAATTTFEVRDEGEGMDAETLARVKEPFFSSKPAGRGMGLGAFLAHLFADRVGGDLRYESAPGQGTRAYLRLPRKGL